jgi:hypothetical protein
VTHLRTQHCQDSNCSLAVFCNYECRKHRSRTCVIPLSGLPGFSSQSQHAGRGGLTFWPVDLQFNRCMMTHAVTDGRYWPTKIAGAVLLCSVVMKDENFKISCVHRLLPRGYLGSLPRACLPGSEQPFCQWTFISVTAWWTVLAS